MERTIIHELEKWKASRYRKPLILDGIRQVGKTWLLREFGRRHYTNTAYFNFEEHPEYREFFETTKDPSRILLNLIMASGQTITPETTLIIFDEIQEVPDAVTALKYFAEHAPEYHIACAGSLLGVALVQSSFPVGKVDFLEVYPMSFLEFLHACGDGNLATYLESLDTVEPLPDAFFNLLYEKLKMYFICGGLPEVVLAWAEDRNVDEVQKRLANIIMAYERDFAKHMSPKDYPKATLIWNSVPSQLAKENKKFIYRVVKKGARAREYEDALQWLCKAKLLVKVYNSAPTLPMTADDDISAFKIYLADVGLLRRLALLDPSVFREGTRLFAEFKGSLSENYVLEALTPQFDTGLRYWAIDHYEVDFLLQRKNDVIPIEVKSGKSVKGCCSLKKFREKYGDAVKILVRFSLENLKLDGDVLNIPLFLADSADKLIGIALRELYGEEVPQEVRGGDGVMLDVYCAAYEAAHKICAEAETMIENRLYWEIETQRALMMRDDTFMPILMKGHMGHLMHLRDEFEEIKAKAKKIMEETQNASTPEIPAGNDRILQEVIDGRTGRRVYVYSAVHKVARKICAEAETVIENRLSHEIETLQAEMKKKTIVDNACMQILMKDQNGNLMHLRDEFEEIKAKAKKIMEECMEER